MIGPVPNEPLPDPMHRKPSHVPTDNGRVRVPDLRNPRPLLLQMRKRVQVRGDSELGRAQYHRRRRRRRVIVVALPLLALRLRPRRARAGVRVRVRARVWTRIVHHVRDRILDLLLQLREGVHE